MNEFTQLAGKAHSKGKTMSMNLGFNKAIVKSAWTEKRSLLLIIPMLNFLTGTDVDLFAPSLPAMSNYFHTTEVAMKSMVTLGVLGFAIAALIMGWLMDSLGHKKIICLSLISFSLISFGITFSESVSGLLVMRFFQGAALAAISVGSRSIIASHFSGKKYLASITYISLAYSLGVIISPAVGGLLQDGFGWKACFYLYAALAILLLVVFLLFANEGQIERTYFSLSQFFKGYSELLKQPVLIFSGMALGLVVLELSIYTMLGSFFMQRLLHFSATSYGLAGIALGIAYATSTFANRFFINKFCPEVLIRIGLFIALLSGGALIVLAVFYKISAATFLLPLFVMNLGLGLVYANVIALAMQGFSKKSGGASATLILGSLIASSITLFGVSTISIKGILMLGIIILTACVLQFALLKVARHKAHSRCTEV